MKAGCGRTAHHRQAAPHPWRPKCTREKTGQEGMETGDGSKAKGRGSLATSGLILLQSTGLSGPEYTPPRLRWSRRAARPGGATPGVQTLLCFALLRAEKCGAQRKALVSIATSSTRGPKWSDPANSCQLSTHVIATPHAAITQPPHEERHHPLPTPNFFAAACPAVTHNGAFPNRASSLLAPQRPRLLGRGRNGRFGPNPSFFLQFITHAYACKLGVVTVRATLPSVWASNLRGQALAWPQMCMMKLSPDTTCQISALPDGYKIISPRSCPGQKQ
jgi:hypothetical protein